MKILTFEECKSYISVFVLQKVLSDLLKENYVSIITSRDALIFEQAPDYKEENIKVYYMTCTDKDDGIHKVSQFMAVRNASPQAGLVFDKGRNSKNP